MNTELIMSGLGTVGLGMGIVIGMLFILMGILYLVIPLFAAISNKKSAKSESSPVSSAPVPSVSAEDDSETVAAIMVAVSAYTGKAPSAFRVVSFKKIN